MRLDLFNDEIISFLAKGVIEPSVSEPNEVLSPIPGSFRLSLTLRPLITLLPTIKMETVESAPVNC